MEGYIVNIQTRRLYQAENMCRNNAGRIALVPQEDNTNYIDKEVYKDWARRSLAKAKDFKDNMLTHKSFQKLYAEYNNGDKLKDIKMTLQLNLRRAIANANKWDNEIHFGKGGFTLDTLIHEIAHIVAPHAEHHGPIFAKVALKLYSRYIGPQYAKDMKRSYTKYKVKVSK